MHARLPPGSSERQVRRYPAADGCHPSVNARETDTSAPVPPAGHPGNEPLAREVPAGQRAPRVSLQDGEERRRKTITDEDRKLKERLFRYGSGRYQAGVSASLHVASTHHVRSQRVSVGAPAGRLLDEPHGSFLQQVGQRTCGTEQESQRAVTSHRCGRRRHPPPSRVDPQPAM